MRDDDAIRWDAREAAMIESHRFRFGDLLVEHPAKRLERIVRNRFDVSLDAGVVEKDVHPAATSCSRLTSATTDSASAEAGSVPMARASPASSRSTATMRAPRSAKSWMVAVPISPAAPVTRATFPFSTRSVMSCQSSPRLEQGDTTRQGTMLVTRTTFRARTGEQLQCHVPPPCASFALEAERSSASVDFEAIRIAWIGDPVVSHAGTFADCEKEQVPRRMSFRGASSLGGRLSCHFVEGSSPHVRRRGAGVCKANGIAILRAERTGARELQMVWIRRTV